jgi:hypothetical protein
MKISVFKSLFSTKETPYSLSIPEVVERIRRGTNDLIKKIEIIRTMSKGQPEYDQAKNKLYAIMFNGTFTERNANGLVEHSGLCILDFDGYPTDKIMEAERQRLINDPYVMIVFMSPGGKGWKAVIRIPKSTASEHKRRFIAYADYFKSDYFDRKNQDVSRVCFESYDPNIYYNEFCQVFEGISEDKGFQYIERPPVCILNDEAKIIELIEKFDFKNQFVEGSRNQFIFEIACCLCDYGISQDIAEHHLYSSYITGSSFSHQEMLNTIKSAYRKSSFNSKYFEDRSTINRVKLKLKNGVNEDEIKKQHNISDEILNDIKDNATNADDIFWTVIQKKDSEVVVIEPLKYSQFLVKNGFNKFYPENAEKPTFVRVIENKVKLSSVDQIKDFVLNYLIDKGHINVWNFCSKSTYLFSENHLNMIDSIYLKMLQDIEDTSFIPYRNGVVKIKRDSTELLSYIDVDGYIWENQIIDRDFNLVVDFDNDFRDLVHKVSNNDQNRIASLESTLGYLVHSFKDKTNQKAIIFNDQEIDENPNGGSGKSLMLTAVGYLRKTVKIDGKSFNPSKSEFLYQRVNLDTQILAFDDVKKNFDFEQLFMIVSEGITVNRKNKDEVFIPFNRSPKIVITTNYVISGAGGSHDRRRHEIEFYQYFNANNSPLKEYGKLLFDQWSKDDWSRFDNYMIKNLQLFLRNGLTKSISINADSKRFIQATSQDFFDFSQDNQFTTELSYYNNELFNQFQNEYNGYKDMNPQRFARWIAEYAKYKEWELEKGKNHKGRFVIFKNR